MSDHQRGAYTPSQDVPLEFDPRGISSRRPLPLALIASAVLLAIMIVAVVVVYRRGVRGDNEPPRPVGEPIAQLKSAPAAGAQPSDGGDVDVTAPQNVPTRAPTFAPPPELPRPRPAPSAGLRVEALPSAEVAAKPAPSAPALAKTTPPPPALPAYPATAAETHGPTETAAAPPRAAPRPQEAKAAAPETGRAAARVQIGAFSSADLADKGWSDIAALLPSVMGGKGKTVEKVEKDGHTLFRTSVTGFTDRQSAEAFCESLKAKGKICFVKS